LQIYKPQITSVLSILHRITGAFLAIGSLLLAAWIVSAAYLPGVFHALTGFFSSILGTLLLVAWTAAYYYHLCNGIRHLFWDAGKGFTLENAARSGQCVLVAAALLTAVTWGYVGGML
jgi:succinate dehydrogenase / fumarate reductase cytochrome b subunit